MDQLPGFVDGIKMDHPSQTPLDILKDEMAAIHLLGHDTAVGHNPTITSADPRGTPGSASAELKPTKISAQPAPVKPTLTKEQIAALPRNALVVGVTQSGKSTFLNAVCEHCGLLPSQKVGTGDFAVTKNCATQAFKTFSKTCAIEGDPSAQEFLDEFLDNLKFEAEIQEYSQSEFKVTLIDTPGLEDSEGNDEVNITDIAQTIQQLQWLSCVVLIIRRTTTLTANVRKSIRYYLELLQDYQSSIIIVHTDWNPVADNYVKETKRRQQIIEEELSGVHGTHFFIDLIVPPPTERRTKAYIQHMTALRCLTLNSILSHINSCPVIPSNTVLIPRTAWIMQCDDKLRIDLDHLQEKAEKKASKGEDKKKHLADEIAACQAGISQAQAICSSIDRRLAAINVDDEIEVASETAAAKWNAPTWKKITVKVVAPCKITNTRIVSDTPLTFWQPPKLTENVAEAVCESKYYQGCFGRLIALAPSKSFHEKEIQEKIQQKKEAEETSEDLHFRLIKIKIPTAQLQQDLRFFTDTIHSISKLRHATSEKKISLDRYVMLLKIYAEPDKKKMISAYCSYLDVPNPYRPAPIHVPIEVRKGAQIRGINQNEYIVQGLLGRGGFGCVWEAIDMNTTKAVAIKEQKRYLGSKDYFPSEVESHKIISAPPNSVPRVPSYLNEKLNEPDQDSVLIMELVPGDRADVHYREGSKNVMSGKDAIKFLLKTLETLDAIHEKGILHRDLKPANIMIHQETLEPWIIDLGIAKPISLAEQQGYNTIIGTVAFGAPEVSMGIVGRFSDIYSLGATVVCLTNMLHDNDTTWKDVLNRCPFSNGLKTILEKMVTFKYKQRYQNCKDVILALKELD